MARQDPTKDSCVGTIVRFVLILGGLITLAVVVF
jgi:hypothetical protein